MDISVNIKIENLDEFKKLLHECGDIAQQLEEKFNQIREFQLQVSTSGLKP